MLDSITAEYLVKAQVPGGVHHHFRWERLIPGTTESRPDLAGYGAWLDARERTVLVPVHDKRDELGSTRYDYRHARTQARILENSRRRQSGANYAVNYRPCMAYMFEW